MEYLLIIYLLIGCGQGTAKTPDNNTNGTKISFSELMEIIKKESMEELENVVGRIDNINEADENGQTALMYTLESGNVEISNLLMDNGADIDISNNEWKIRALEKAIDNEREGILEILVKKGVDQDVLIDGNKTPLMYASKEGNRKIAEILIDGGHQKIDATDDYGGNALFYSVVGKKGEILELLVDRGADMEEEVNGGQKVLIYAIGDNNIDVMNRLLDKGADIDAVDKSGTTALISAVFANNEEIVKLLVDRGAKKDLHYLDKNALAWAEKYKFEAIVNIIKGSE